MSSKKNSARIKLREVFAKDTSPQSQRIDSKQNGKTQGKMFSFVELDNSSSSYARKTKQSPQKKSFSPSKLLNSEIFNQRYQHNTTFDQFNNSGNFFHQERPESIIHDEKYLMKATYILADKLVKMNDVKVKSEGKNRLLPDNYNQVDGE
mmetsp:Transcript_10248/g.8801  ORF Transcript_10248/g.8801 Transcript_10248/m.8801 type:complete len:150 (-) Transcript_10248:744-1193(-)